MNSPPLPVLVALALFAAAALAWLVRQLLREQRWRRREAAIRSLLDGADELERQLQQCRLRMQELSEEQWLQLARQAAYRPPMPNHALRIMEEDDLRSIHRFVVQLGEAGQPAPAALAPGQTPAGPAVLFPAPPAP